MSRSCVTSEDLFCVWRSDVSVTQAFYNASDQESLSSVLWV